MLFTSYSQLRCGLQEDVSQLFPAVCFAWCVRRCKAMCRGERKKDGDRREEYWDAGVVASKYAKDYKSMTCLAYLLVMQTRSFLPGIFSSLLSARLLIVVWTAHERYSSQISSSLPSHAWKRSRVQTLISENAVEPALSLTSSYQPSFRRGSPIFPQPMLSHVGVNMYKQHNNWPSGSTSYHSDRGSLMSLWQNTEISAGATDLQQRAVLFCCLTDKRGRGSFHQPDQCHCCRRAD